MRSVALRVVPILAAVLVGCALDPTAARSPFDSDGGFPLRDLSSNLAPLRVWDDPYADVQWSSTLRLLAQTHDHAATSATALLAYDSAGYSVVPLMDYSGVASLSYTRKRRLWPPDSVLAPTLSSSLRNIRVWAPAAEEVGFHHVISLFLTEYIAKWESDQYATRQPWMYASGQETIDLVNARGGFPILAHPWGPSHWTSGLRRFRGIEIYSAFAEHRRESGSDPFFTDADRNAELLRAWDRSLSSGELVVGFAVNDHFGPDSRAATLTARVRDSGKSIILAADSSLPAVRDAVVNGRVLAVRDFGEVKRQFMTIDSMRYTNGVISVHTAGRVRWIADGRVVDEGRSSLMLDSIPRTTRYVRVEVESPDGSTVYSQAFRLRPRGDVNGDWSVDARDAAICANATGGILSPRVRRACDSRTRHGIN